MADLSITAANIIAASGAVTRYGTAGATITAGDIVYLDTTDNEYKLPDADAWTDTANVYMALNGASDGQPLTVLQSGDVAMGSILTAGTAYYLSGTAGGIMPAADLTTGDEVVQVGIAKSATTLAFRPVLSGVEL